MRMRNVNVVELDGVELTTIGLVYNVHEDLEGFYIFDDFGDKLYINEDDFETT